MSSPRFAGKRKWHGVLFAAGVVALFGPFFPAGRAEAAPRFGRKPAVKADAASPALTSGVAPSAEPQEFADALPSSHPAAPDLRLSKEDERRAEAFASFARGLVAEDNADTDGALAGYRRALEFDPAYAELSVKVAYELARRNDVSAGIQVLKDTVKAAAKEPLPLIYLSQLYSKYLKKPDLALKYAEQALALAPDHFGGYQAVYELHVAASQPKKAEQILERAAKSSTRDAKYWLQLGETYTRSYLKEDGSSEPAALEKMNAVYRKAAELGADDPVIISKVGDYFILSRQVAEAIPFYLAVLDLKPHSEVPLDKLRDKLARAFLVTEKRDEAITMLEQLTKENPLRSATFEFLGELYQQKGDREKALANFQQSLLLNSSQPDNYLRLTEMLLQTKQFEKAVETMQTARAKFPDVPQIAFSLGIALSQAKRHTDAMRIFAEAEADAQNNHEELLTAGFYFQYGAAAEQAGMTQKAAELLKQCIALEPGSAAQAYNYLGYMWTELGENLDEAGEMIKKAVEMEPDNGAFLDSLGWFYYKKGDPERAVKELLRAAENIKPEDPVVFDHLGDAYHKLGRTAEALTYWRKALALEQENKKIAEKIESVKEKVTKSEAPPAP
jgi:tetratricopeptide (TPR) repeat protein